MVDLIKTENICKNYKDFFLDNVNINVKKGEIFGFLGPNGSGKTTLVKILTGQILPTSGKAEILGEDLIENPIKIREKIGIIPEQENPPSFMTVKEYLEFICNLRNIENKEDVINEWLKFFEFENQKNFLIKDLSRGTKQKILATQAFIHQPELVFIDEPLINLDPRMQKKFKEFLTNYVKKGNSIFLSTHVLSIAEEICTRIGIVKEGKIIVSKKISDIKKGKTKLEDYFIEEVENE